MAEGLPPYLEDWEYDLILERILGRLPDNLDKFEGSFLFDVASVTALELERAAEEMAKQMLERSFALTTFGEYLDMRVAESGLQRLPAVKAKGKVTFFGEENIRIPTGTLVATTSSDETESVEFETVADARIESQGRVTVTVEAVEPGAGGNVPASAINLLSSPVDGISRVINEEPTSGGLDEESDPSLLARYLERVRNPSSSGNKADYVRWAKEVEGVGGVSVLPIKYGPGTVSVAIIGTDKTPARPNLVSRVQEYIAPPHQLEQEARTMTVGGFGTSVDGTAVKMEYDAQGEGSIRQLLQDKFPQPGVWIQTIEVKTDPAGGDENLLRVGVWNHSTDSWAMTSATGTEQAVRVLKGSDLGSVFEEITVEFYWNGQDRIELQVDRLTTDSANTVWVDRVRWVSAFSRDDGDGKAPIGARVFVEPATAVMVSVSATLRYATGVEPASVRAAVKQELEEYIKTLAFAVSNSVAWTAVGKTILGVQGVVDYSDLLINGGTSNIEIGPQEVAVLGSVALT